MRQLRTLLQNPKWIKRVIDVDGDKAGILHILALNFNALYVREVVSILAKAGIDIDRKSGQTGELPLHLATLYGNVEMVKGLLDNGARIDLSDIRGFTPRGRCASPMKNRTLKFKCLVSLGKRKA